MTAAQKRLWDAVGGLSNTSKMPCYSWSIDARRCITGAKLRREAGTVCAACYAYKGQYVMTNTTNAMKRRLVRYRRLGPINWSTHMASLIGSVEKSGYFRWFDSGDLQDAGMFHAIIRVARALPQIEFWLPTREQRIVQDMMKAVELPPNLVVRLGAALIDRHPGYSKHWLRSKGVLGSMVHTMTSSLPVGGHACPAKSHGGTCNNSGGPDCRACWSKTVELVSYELH